MHIYWKNLYMGQVDSGEQCGPWASSLNSDYLHFEEDLVLYLNNLGIPQE
jgi:hypothetical protein